MNPVGRRESLDASHQAQKLQVMLQELLVWAQRLRAEMDTQSAPRSPAEAQNMLEKHQEHKVSSWDPGTFPRILPPLYPLPYCDPNLLLGPFSVTCLCLSPLPSHPLSGLPSLLLLTGPPPALKASFSGI